MKHRLNQIITMSNEALLNYGQKYEDRKYKIVHIATRYMPAKEFYNQGMPQGFHPGYDIGVKPMQLYDLMDIETSEHLPFSLYEWEVE